LTTLFVNSLTVVDFSYLHPQRGLLGESWRLDISLSGNLDQQGMVLDFADVKRQVKQLVDLEFDHKLIIPALSEAVRFSRQEEYCALQFQRDDGAVVEHFSPAAALCQLQANSVTPQSVAAAMTASLLSEMPANVTDLTIRLSPEQIEGPYYHYSHGLKRHCGNCQRIAHGHRSKIEILRDGVPDVISGREWAERWRDIYIGCSEDLVAEERGQHHYRYHASQGDFELRLPAAHSYLIDNDSTVENLAQHIADKLRQQHSQSSFEVYAYEGIGKGAVGKS
jgi:6-pyruvoyl-tetrahydropterin synthase